MSIHVIKVDERLSAYDCWVDSASEMMMFNRLEGSDLYRMRHLILLEWLSSSSLSPPGNECILSSVRSHLEAVASVNNLYL